MIVGSPRFGLKEAIVVGVLGALALGWMFGPGSVPFFQDVGQYLLLIAVAITLIVIAFRIRESV